MVCDVIIIIATQLNVFVYNMQLSLYAVLKTEEMYNPHEIYTIKNRATIWSRVINLNVAVSA